MERKREVVGVISDTHGLLRPQALEALEGVDLILHAGDIGGEAILATLGEIAPVVAVRGNNDRDAWADRLSEVERIVVGGVAVTMIHDRKMLKEPPGDGVVVSGHSHKPSVVSEGEVLYLNPGSAGPRRFRLPIALARLVIEGEKAKGEIVELA